MRSFYIYGADPPIRKLYDFAHFAYTFVRFAAVMLIVFMPRRDEMKGIWAPDDTAVYAFNGRGNGALLLPPGSYECSYSIEDKAQAFRHKNTWITTQCHQVD